MGPLEVQIVNDENNRPIAVQIPYAQWLEIKSALTGSQAPPSVDLARFSGTMQLSEDPLAYQHRIRGEWS